jgi:hypothetical protein
MCNNCDKAVKPEISTKRRDPSRRSDDDDVYLELRHGKGFHNLVYMSYIKHMNPVSKA